MIPRDSHVQEFLGFRVDFSLGVIPRNFYSWEFSKVDFSLGLIPRDSHIQEFLGFGNGAVFSLEMIPREFPPPGIPRDSHLQEFSGFRVDFSLG